MKLSNFSLYTLSAYKYFEDEKEKIADAPEANCPVQEDPAHITAEDLNNKIEKSTSPKKTLKSTLVFIMRDLFVSIVVFVLVTLVAQDWDLNRKNRIFVQPLSAGGTSDGSVDSVAPAAATPSGGVTGSIRRHYNMLENQPFFDEKHSYVDDYFEGHVHSAFQVGLWDIPS